MYKTKRITVSLLLVMVMFMVFCIPTMAADTVPETSIENSIIVVDENSSNVDVKDELFIDIPIITVDESSSDGGISKTTSDIKINPEATSIYYCKVRPLVIRSGNTTTCQLYFFWQGDQIMNAWRFNQLNITNTSSLSPTTYATVGSRTISAVAGVTGSVYITNVSIPTNVETVKVKTSGLQGYRLSPTTGWTSFSELNSTVSLN